MPLSSSNVTIAPVESRSSRKASDKTVSPNPVLEMMYLLPAVKVMAYQSASPAVSIVPDRELFKKIEAVVAVDAATSPVFASLSDSV